MKSLNNPKQSIAISTGPKAASTIAMAVWCVANSIGLTMKFIIYALIVALFVSPIAHSELDTSYFKIGEWRLGENRKALLSDGSPFKNIEEVVKNKEYKAVVDNVFSENTPANIYFKGRNLHRLELTLYEGSEYEKANAAAKLIISTLERKFEGAFLEGLTTSEGLKPDMFDVVVGQLLEKSKVAMEEINNDGDEDAYFNLFISLSTEYESKGNFIYGKFSYFGHTDIYNVSVFEDKKFNSDHVAPAMIHIGSRSSANRQNQRGSR